MWKTTAHFVGSCGADRPGISFEALLTGQPLFEAQQLTTLERNGCCLPPRRYKYISIYVYSCPLLSQTNSGRFARVEWVSVHTLGGAVKKTAQKGTY